MTAHPLAAGSQAPLDRLTRRWWFYALLVVIFFLPTQTEIPFDPRNTTAVVGQVLASPLIFSIQWLMPVAKALLVAAVVAVFRWGNRARRAFDLYVAVLYLALALFQTMAHTADYGFAVMAGNLALVLIVSLAWFWETAAPRNDFGARRRALWRWWVAPLALFALLEPIDTATMAPSFAPLRLLTNEAGLTYCLTTPAILAVLTLFHPTVNRPLLRLSAFVGILLGLVNMAVWFGAVPGGWWMGVLHLPLLIISLYAFGLALRRP